MSTDLRSQREDDAAPGVCSSPSCRAAGVGLVLLTLLVCAPTSAASQTSASDDAGSPPSADASTDTEEAFPPDVSGVWGQKLVQTALSDVPVLGESRTTTVTYLRTRIEQSGREIELTSRVCDIDVQSNVDSFETIVPERFVEAFPPTTRTGRLSQEDGATRFRIERHVEVRGARLRNPEHEYLPDTPDDPRVIDADADGRPGLTLRVDGLVSGKLYVVQRGWDRYFGRVVSDDRMIGDVAWDSTQKVLDSTNMFLGDQPPTRPHPDDAEHRVEFVRLDGDADCASILTDREALF